MSWILKLAGFIPRFRDQPAELFTARRFAVLLGMLIAVSFPEIISGRKAFFFRDFGLFAYPLAFYQRECFWRGELPLWNPLNNCGLPFLAQWNTMVLYPGSLFYLLLPLSWSLAVFCLLHQFWAGLGMFYLARSWTGNGWAASVAGVAFAFNGLTLNSLMWPAQVATLAWMPWVVLWVERAWQEGGRAIIWAVIAGTFQMLAGAPEVVLLTWLILGLMALSEAAPERKTGIDQSWMAKLRVLWGRFWLIVVLISGLTAVQWLPFFDLVLHSQRTAGFDDSSWSMPGTGWANLLVPLFHCFPSTLNVYFQYDQRWVASYYLGTATLALALTALGRGRSRRLIVLALVSCLGLVLAMGKHGFLYAWCKAAFPLLGFVRYPVKFVMVASFSLPLMMAYGVRNLLSTGRPTVGVLWGNALLVLIAIGGVIGFEWAYPMSLDNWTATWHNAVGRAGFLVMTIALLHLAARGTASLRQFLLQWAVVCLVWADLVTHEPWQNPSITRAGLEPGIVQLPTPPVIGRSRVMTSAFAEKFRWKTDVPDALQLYLGYRLGLFCDCNLLEGMAKVNGFYALYLKEADVICSLLYTETGPPLTGLMDFLGVSHITADGKLMDWEYRPSFLPLVTAGQKPVFGGDLAILHALRDPRFNGTNIVLLPREAQAGITSREKQNVRIASYGFASHRLTMEVDAPAPALLVVAQAYYHNWHAYVDGRRTPLWRANYAFQALEVPDGRHRVELVYVDWAFWMGLLFAVVTALIGAGWCYKARNTRG